MRNNSIEFLIKSLEHLTGLNFEGEQIIKEAEEMYKQERFEAWSDGYNEGVCDGKYLNKDKK